MKNIKNLYLAIMLILMAFTLIICGITIIESSKVATVSLEQTVTYDAPEYIDVTFDAGEGYFSENQHTYETTIKINTLSGTSIFPTAPTRDGYTFNGWEYSVNDSNYISLSDGANMPFTDHLYVRAKYRINASISFATSSLDKLTTDTSFTNSLTNTGNGMVTYTSSDTSVATVNASTGAVTIVSAGSTTITATVTDTSTHYYATKTTTYTITVRTSTTFLTASQIVNIQTASEAYGLFGYNAEITNNAVISMRLIQDIDLSSAGINVTVSSGGLLIETNGHSIRNLNISVGSSGSLTIKYGEIFGNVTVNGGSATFEGTSIVGDISITGGGQMTTPSGTYFNGNITISGQYTSVRFNNGSLIEGDMTIDADDGVVYFDDSVVNCDVTITDGDVSFSSCDIIGNITNNDGYVSFSGCNIVGNITNNGGTLIIDGEEQ